MSNTSRSSQRSSLGTTDRPESAGSSLRTYPSVAFFHDGVTTSEIDLRFNMMDAQRRARAIATAPRRNRDNDDDDDDRAKKSVFRFAKTSAVPIPHQSVTPQTQSLPQTQSAINLIPSFRVDPPAREDSDDLEYLYTMGLSRNRCSSGPLP